MRVYSWVFSTQGGVIIFGWHYNLVFTSFVLLSFLGLFFGSAFCFFTTLSIHSHGGSIDSWCTIRKFCVLQSERRALTALRSPELLASIVFGDAGFSGVHQKDFSSHVSRKHRDRVFGPHLQPFPVSNPGQLHICLDHMVLPRVRSPVRSFHCPSASELSRVSNGLCSYACTVGSNKTFKWISAEDYSVEPRDIWHLSKSKVLETLKAWSELLGVKPDRGTRCFWQHQDRKEMKYVEACSVHLTNRRL